MHTDFDTEKPSPKGWVFVMEPRPGGAKSYSAEKDCSKNSTNSHPLPTLNFASYRRLASFSRKSATISNDAASKLANSSIAF